MSNDDTGTSDKEGKDETSTQEATQPDKKPSEASQTDNVVLSKKDYDELVSKRDANFSNAENALKRLEAREQAEARDSYIKEFLEDSENKEKYPDVKPEDLKYALDEEDVKAIAERTQKRVEDIRQGELEKIQVTNSQPQYTPEEAEKHLRKVKKEVDEGKRSDGFEQYVNTNLNT